MLENGRKYLTCDNALLLAHKTAYLLSGTEKKMRQSETAKCKKALQFERGIVTLGSSKSHTNCLDWRKECHY